MRPSPTVSDQSVAVAFIRNRIAGKTRFQGQSIRVERGGEIQVENSELYSMGSWDASPALDIFGDADVVGNSIICGLMPGYYSTDQRDIK